MPDRDLLAELRLTLVPGIGPRLRSLLLGRFGSAADVFRASRGELREVPRVGAKLVDAILDPNLADEAVRERERCERDGVSLLAAGDGRYPRMLTEIPDPPGLLYVRGELARRDLLGVAIVGSRECTPYGEKWARTFAGGLARAGVTVVSGLARGIDRAAHEGALDAGGRTVAVVATGLATVYPPEHRGLAGRVADSGAVVTEFPLDTQPRPGHFPQRNRIISGMSLGVVVVEAGRKSGALHTARHSLEQGRDVFAVPGPIDSPASAACHDLIRDGATLVRGVDDVLEAMGPLIEEVGVEATGGGPAAEFGDAPAGPSVERAATEPVRNPRELLLDDQQRAVLGGIDGEAVDIDSLLAKPGLAEIGASRLLATLTVLEMKRLVRRLPGNKFARRD